MDVAGVAPPGQQRPRDGRSRADWLAPALAGAAAFWVANLAISATPVAAGYRAALSIPYGPMLAEAAVAGLVLGGVVAVVLDRFPSKVAGSTRLRKSLLLGAVTLAVVTIGIETPSKLGSDLDDAAHWLVVASAINLIRILALAIAVGLVADARAGHHGRRAGRRAEKGVPT